MQIALQSVGIQSEADRLRARAIWLYHVEGATQNDIATIRTIAPTALITDEQTALALLS
jgi:hypothetical protein